MFIHIGEDDYIYKNDIIAILDRKSIDSRKISSDFIDSLIKDNCLVGKLDSSVKTYILLSENNKIKIYTSTISTKALANRNSWLSELKSEVF